MTNAVEVEPWDFTGLLRSAGNEPVTPIESFAFRTRPDVLAQLVGSTLDFGTSSVELVLLDQAEHEVFVLPGPYVASRSGAWWPSTIALHTPVEPFEFEVPPQSEVLGLLDRIQRALDLGARVAARLAGVSLRRYYELLHGDPMPLPRLLAAARLVDVLNRFYASDPELLSSFLDAHEDEAVGLLLSGQYAQFAGRLSELRIERARQLMAVPRASRPDVPTGNLLRDIREILHGPAFEAILGLFRRVAPAVNADKEAWRLTSLADMEAAYEVLQAADALDENFEFLLTLDRHGLEEFRRKAEGLIEDPSSTPEKWAEFVSATAERAFGAYEPLVAGPIVEGPDEAALGPIVEEDVDFFRRLGVDVAAGRLLNQA